MSHQIEFILWFLGFKSCKDNSYVNKIKLFNTEHLEDQLLLFSTKPVTVGWFLLQTAYCFANKSPKGYWSLTWLQWALEIALKYTKMTKSKKTSKTRQIFDYRMEPKITKLLPICFKITAMHWFYCCSLPIWRRSPLEKRPLIDLFLPRPGSTPGRNLPKSLNTGAGPWVLHPYQVL